MDYEKYIKSDAWAAKRRATFKAHGRACRICGEVRPDNQVHHKTYKRLGKENVAKDLVVLCQKHHSALHDFHQKGDLTLEDASVYYIARTRRAAQQRAKRARAKRKMTTPQKKKKKKTVSTSRRRKKKKSNPVTNKQKRSAHLQKTRFDNPFLHRILTENE